MWGGQRFGPVVTSRTSILSMADHAAVCCLSVHVDFLRLPSSALGSLWAGLENLALVDH